MASPTTVTGVLLAAGAGRRSGGPKALRRWADGTPWVTAAVRTLLDGGCSEVVVVLGCRADEICSVLAGERVITVVAPNWPSGMRASLAAGIARVRRTLATAVLIHLVDLPDVSAAVVRRVLDAGPVQAATLRRAGYHGQPGHPVLIGAAHLAAVFDPDQPDRGAQGYLLRAGAALVPCEDLASGHDVDAPERLRR